MNAKTTEMDERVEFLPNKAELEKKYRSYESSFTTLLSRIVEHLGCVVKLKSTPSFRSRVKSFSSYYEKLLKYPPRGIPDDLPINITDIIAVRIVCSFMNDIAIVEQLLKDNFEIVEIEKKGAGRAIVEFGYESTHVLLKIPKNLKAGLSLPAGLVFEIQIRTILQDAWAEVEHELVYKADFSPFDLPLKRKMAAINASLTLADIIFQEIRDYQNKLNIAVDKRRNSFYEKADDFTTKFLDSEVSQTKQALKIEAQPNTYDPDSIDDLILAAIVAHNAGEFEKAEKIYTKIIDKTDNNVVLSVIFKHRGVAFFAQGDYERSLADFMRSVTYDESNFRAHYYVGIALTLLDRHEEAIQYFTKSLELNPYQAHVSFRRALSYYKVGKYVAAIKDIDRAVSLGYTEAAAQKLRVEISKKMQII